MSKSTDIRAKKNIRVWGGFEPGSPSEESKLPAESTDHVQISSFDDDPVVAPSVVEKLPKSYFYLDRMGKPTGLQGPRVKLVEPQFVQRYDSETGELINVARNPWTLPKPDQRGNFIFNEPDVPVRDVIDRNADGTPRLDADGLQIWKAQSGHVAQSTIFEAANHTIHYADKMAGRFVPVGSNGQLTIYPHAIDDDSSFYFASDRALRFATYTFKLGEEIRDFETGLSWETASHETGHAVHHALKPNAPWLGAALPETVNEEQSKKASNAELALSQWGESFATQMAMWSSLEDRDRVKTVLDQTGGDLSKPNDVTRFTTEYILKVYNPANDPARAIALEETATTIGNKKLSEVPESPPHLRAAILNQACYDIFQKIVASIREKGASAEQAVIDAAQIMGTLNVRAADYTPENVVTLEDVSKAYLTVDQNLFGGRFGNFIKQAMLDRELLEPEAVSAWERHRATLPSISVGGPMSLDSLLAPRGRETGVPPGFGIRIEASDRTAEGRTIVRLQLTEGVGRLAVPLDNHGIAVFSPKGQIEELHSPWPAGDLSAERVKTLLAEARARGLEDKGPLCIHADKADAFVTVRPKA